MILNPGDEIGGFRIESPLGSGGMGTVYRARQTKLGREVALKVITFQDEGDPESIKRFQRETELMMQLSHPHLVTVYDGGCDAGREYLAMEIVEGGTLEELIRGSGALGLNEGLRIILEIAQAVEYLHSRSIAHRDIKPVNVMLTAEGKPKLTDFGLARADHHTLMTRASQIIGTPRYIAPEILHGEGATIASDVFSLGVLAYRVLTAQFPFPAGSYGEYLRAVTTQDPVPVEQLRPEIPAVLADLIMKMLSKGARDRPESKQVVVLLEDQETWKGPVRIVTAGVTAREPFDPMVSTARRSGRRSTRDSLPTGQRPTVTRPAVATAAGPGRRGAFAAVATLLVLAAGLGARTRQDEAGRTVPMPCPSPSAGPARPSELEARADVRRMRGTLRSFSAALRARMVARSEIEETMVLKNPEVDRGYYELSQQVQALRQLIQDIGGLDPASDVWIDIHDTVSVGLDCVESMIGTVRHFAQKRKLHGRLLTQLRDELAAKVMTEVTLAGLVRLVLAEECERQLDDVTPGSGDEAAKRRRETPGERKLDLLLKILAKLDGALSEAAPEDPPRRLAQSTRLLNLILNGRFGRSSTLYRLGDRPPVTEEFRQEVSRLFRQVDPFLEDPTRWKGAPDRLVDLLEHTARAAVCVARMQWLPSDRGTLVAIEKQTEKLLEALSRITPPDPRDRGRLESLARLGIERLNPQIKELGPG